MSIKSKAATFIVAGLLATGVSVGASAPAQAYTLTPGAICKTTYKVLNATTGKTEVHVYRWVDLRYLGGGWHCNWASKYIYYQKVW